MLRERHKERTSEADSIDACRWGGAIRSSDEGFVMKLERRGSVVTTQCEINRKGG
jgi:hypothetical protein